MTPGAAFFVKRLLNALALCMALLAAGEATAAPLKVVGRFLQDTHGNNILMRGVNVPVYKSGWVDDLDAVAAAINLTKTNVVRLEWWAVPPGGAPYYTLANLDRAIQKFYDLGIIPVVELHDLTYQYGQDGLPDSPNSKGNDRVLFANTITAFWTRADVLAVLKKHQDHLVINIANEWGSIVYSDGTPTTANFIQNYTDAITVMRNAGIIAPLLVDAPKGFEYQFLLDHGAALLAADPQNNTILSIHTYWAATYYTDADVITILDTLKTSGLPVVIGEASSNAWTNIQCDPIDYANLLTRANTNGIGYLFWAWYEDGTCGQLMNITVGPNGDGVTLPTRPGYGYDALYGAGYGIDAAQPPTLKADFSPVVQAVLNTSFGYNVTSTEDGTTRAATAQVTRLNNNSGPEQRPVVVLMPGWGGSGDVPAAVGDPQASMFANQGYVALNIGFHQTSLGTWYSDLAESAKAALDVLCAQVYADCSAVAITGESYGGTQIHPVVRYLRANGVYDGSGGVNAGRKVVAMLGQDSGYTLYGVAPYDADATAYSIAMIENLGDGDFPVDSCAYGNCGARNRADYHQSAPGSQYVVSYCPPGGSHGSRGYANWDAWVLSAVKTMLHNQRGVPKFTGYAEPNIAVSNACLTALPSVPTIGTASAGNASISVAFTSGAIGSGSLISYWAGCTKDSVTYIYGTGANSPINVTGLVNGSAYSCAASTQSTVGYGPWSAYSNTVIPAAPPGAPTNITVTAYPGRLQVSFTAPVDSGGSTITGYTVTCTAAGQTTRTNTGASSPIIVYGLTPGVAYSCTVTASNTAATSMPSTSVTSTALRIDLTPILMLLLDD